MSVHVLYYMVNNKFNLMTFIFYHETTKMYPVTLPPAVLFQFNEGFLFVFLFFNI